MIVLDPKLNDVSFSLNLLRAASAQAVCVGHALSYFKIEALLPPNMPYMQNIAVLLFFLISGFLIAYTLRSRSQDPSYGFSRYAVDRVARIYSGLLPALVVVIIVDWLMKSAGRYDLFDKQFDVWTFFANVGMLEVFRITGVSIFEWPTFGSNAALWTLSIEFHIYLFVGALYFLFQGSRWWPLLLVVIFVFARLPLSVLFGAVTPEGVGQGLFALWLGGFSLAYVLGSDRMPLVACILLALASIWGYLASMVPSKEYTVALYPYLVGFFGAIVLASSKTRITYGTWISRVIAYLANYSFTLYLIHYTLINAMIEVMPAKSGLSVVASVLLCNVVALTIAKFTERRHKAWAAQIWRVVGGFRYPN